MPSKRKPTKQRRQDQQRLERERREARKQKALESERARPADSGGDGNGPESAAPARKGLLSRIMGPAPERPAAASGGGKGEVRLGPDGKPLRPGLFGTLSDQRVIVIGIVLALATSISVFFLPLIRVDETVDGAVVERTVSLLENNGAGAALFLLFPPAMAASALLKDRSPRPTRTVTIAAVSLALWVFLAAGSIGTLYLPATFMVGIVAWRLRRDDRDAVAGGAQPARGSGWRTKRSEDVIDVDPVEDGASATTEPVRDDPIEDDLIEDDLAEEDVAEDDVAKDDAAKDAEPGPSAVAEDDVIEVDPMDGGLAGLAAVFEELLGADAVAADEPARAAIGRSGDIGRFVLLVLARLSDDLVDEAGPDAEEAFYDEVSAEAKQALLADDRFANLSAARFEAIRLGWVAAFNDEDEVAALEPPSDADAHLRWVQGHLCLAAVCAARDVGGVGPLRPRLLAHAADLATTP